jgi:hypothetical protein
MNAIQKLYQISHKCQVFYFVVIKHISGSPSTLFDKHFSAYRSEQKSVEEAGGFLIFSDALCVNVPETLPYDLIREQFGSKSHD